MSIILNAFEIILYIYKEIKPCKHIVTNLYFLFISIIHYNYSIINNYFVNNVNDFLFFSI